MSRARDPGRGSPACLCWLVQRENPAHTLTIRAAQQAGTPVSRRNRGSPASPRPATLARTGALNALFAAMRLARYFGGDARSWLNLQAAYDLRRAEIENARTVEREITPLAV